MSGGVTRRKFLATSAAALAAGGLGAYSFHASGALEVNELTIPLEGLPAAFEAFLSDLHHGWFISREYLSEAISRTNALGPDLVVLGGDYVDSDPAYIAPVIALLRDLKAPFGVFAVIGNRDVRAGRDATSRELARQGISELTNRGVALRRDGSELWLCGFDDATTGRPDAQKALAEVPADGFAILVSHHPDAAELLRDTRTRLVLAGHTHGGQINLPLIGPPFIPSSFGQKYARGLAQAPKAKVFITTGVGSFFPPLRFRCPPEVALLTLTREVA
jgi:predicted MPP superfamily phosphohydrolase